MTEVIEKKIKSIIIDDERLAVKGVELLLKDYPEVKIVGVAANINNAARLVENHDPDLIFLDIQLQGETGFDLFERTRVNAKVIFITAYDAYAVRAFEINALDYLLKPVSRERFSIAMNRLKACDSDGRVQNSQLTYSDVVVLNTGSRMRFIKLDQILSITAEGDYTRVSLKGDKDELVLKPMKAWHAQLPSDQFARIHRSTILNLEHVRKIEKTSSNRYLAYLPEKTRPLPMSQRYSVFFRKRFKPNMIEKLKRLR